MPLATFSLAAALLAAGCGPEAETAGQTENAPEAETYPVSLVIDFDSNLIFNCYDVSVYVDDEELGHLDHGEDGQFEIDLENGPHTFKVEKEDDGGITGEETFDVDENLKRVGYEIDCEFDGIYTERLDTVESPISSEDVVGRDAEDLEMQFKNAGFSLVSIEKKKDLPLEKIDDAGKVTGVSIAGIDAFQQRDPYLAVDNVVITTSVPEDIAVPASADAMEGKYSYDVVDELKAAGFVNIKEVEVEPDLTRSVEYTVKSVKIGGGLLPDDDFSEGDTFPYDAEIEIEYVGPGTASGDASGTDSSPDEWDLEWEARKTFESYGSVLYPYGFKCHWYADLVTCEPQGDGTFFIKVGVTITNEYGTKTRTYAQGISGNGNVVDFYVS